MKAFIEKHNLFFMFFTLIIVIKVATYFYLPDYYKLGVALIMASLVGLYNTSVERQHIGVLIGMIFLLFGDAFQLFNNTTFINISYICYMIACIGFIMRYRIGIRSYKIPSQKMLLALPVLILSGFALFSGGYTGSPAVFILYGLGFSALTLFATLRSEKVKGYTEVILGSFLFGIYGLLQLVQFSTMQFHQTMLIILHAVATFLMIIGVIIGSKLRTKPEKTPIKKKK